MRPLIATLGWEGLLAITKKSMHALVGRQGDAGAAAQRSTSFCPCVARWFTFTRDLPSFVLSLMRREFFCFIATSSWSLCRNACSIHFSVVVDGFVDAVGGYVCKQDEQKAHVLVSAPTIRVPKKTKCGTRRTIAKEKRKGSIQRERFCNIHLQGGGQAQNNALAT